MVGSVQPRASSAVAPEKPSRLQENLMEMERGRERYWRGHPGTSALKLCWRAATVRHSFQHLLPGESILESRRGQRAVDQAPQSEVLRGENPITAAVFNREFGARRRAGRGARFVHVEDLERDLPAARLRLRSGHRDSVPQRLRAELARHPPPAEARREPAVLRGELLEPTGGGKECRAGAGGGPENGKRAVPDRPSQIPADADGVAAGLYRNRRHPL